MTTLQSHPVSQVPPATLAAVRMLVDADILGSIEDVVDFLEKPHKWQPELDLWERAGSPQPDTPGLVRGSVAPPGRAEPVSAVGSLTELWGALDRLAAASRHRDGREEELAVQAAAQLGATAEQIRDAQQ